MWTEETTSSTGSSATGASACGVSDSAAVARAQPKHACQVFGLVRVEHAASRPGIEIWSVETRRHAGDCSLGSRPTAEDPRCRTTRTLYFC